VVDVGVLLDGLGDVSGVYLWPVAAEADEDSVVDEAVLRLRDAG
jgi:hypothetical protein